MDPNLHQDLSEREISLKDVVLTIQEYLREIRAKWKVLATFIMLATLFCFFKLVTTPVHYMAECSFMLNEKENSIGLSGLLGEFGLPGNNEFSLEKIVELSKTRTMTQAVLMEKAEVGGLVDFLANHFIEVLESEGTWVPSAIFTKQDELVGFRFGSDSLIGVDRMESRAIQTLNRRLVERLSTDVNEASGILTFSFESPNEEISYEVLQGLFKNLSNYYTNKSTEKQQATYKTFASKCDSLEQQLDAKDYQLANFKDTYRSQWLNVEKTTEDKLFRDIRMLSIMYGEALKNKEIAAFSLANVRPFIQSIDLPMYPLKRIELVWWRQLLIGIGSGLFLGVAYVVLKKIYVDLMS